MALVGFIVIWSAHSQAEPQDTRSSLKCTQPEHASPTSKSN